MAASDHLCHLGVVCPIGLSRLFGHHQGHFIRHGHVFREEFFGGCGDRFSRSAYGVHRERRPWTVDLPRAVALWFVRRLENPSRRGVGGLLSSAREDPVIRVPLADISDKNPRLDQIGISRAISHDLSVHSSSAFVESSSAVSKLMEECFS